MQVELWLDVLWPLVAVLVAKVCGVPRLRRVLVGPLVEVGAVRYPMLLYEWLLAEGLVG